MALRRPRRIQALWLALACTIGVLPAAAQPGTAGVAVLTSAPWSPGDGAREGAGEFLVFLQAAQLQRVHVAAGLVALTDRHGMLRCGGERALRRVALSGVAVVKLLPAAVAEDEAGDHFLHAQGLAAEQAAAVLRECLERHGAPPAVRNPDAAQAAELAALRTHLAPFQIALDAAAWAKASRVAAE